VSHLKLHTGCCVEADSVEKDIDDAKLLAVLHSLYSITFTPPGRDAVVTVFALDDNVAVLLPFIEMNGLCRHCLFVSS